MTQLYSNLVYNVRNTTYLCLVLVVLGSPKVSRVRLALLYTAPLSHAQLSKHSPFIDLERQHMVTKTKS